MTGRLRHDYENAYSEKSKQQIREWQAKLASTEDERARIAARRHSRRLQPEPHRAKPVKYDPSLQVAGRRSPSTVRVLEAEERAEALAPERRASPQPKAPSSPPARGAVLGLKLFIRLLPADARPRYGEEYKADMLSLPRGQQLEFVLNMLSAVVRIRRSLSDNANDVRSPAE